MPQNVEAERAVLGSILIDPDAIGEVAGILQGSADFYNHDHRMIYEAMLSLYQDGVPTDVITVINRLRDHAHLDEIGGTTTVSQLANSVPTSANIASYAAIVREHADKRQAIGPLETLLDAALHADHPSFSALRRTVGEMLLEDDTQATRDEPAILFDDEAEALEPPRGILGNLLFEESVSYLYGPSGRWKSFVALSWGLAIATGRQWLGRPVIEGDVLYVCSEGARGTGQRVTAWKRHHGVIGRTRLRIMQSAIDLASGAQVQAFIRRISALDIHPVMIVFDTLAASNSGDEDTATNASAVTRAARRIIQACEGACVLIVHHTGYDVTHMRGSSGFYNNADTVIRMEGGDANRRMEPGQPITLISDKPKNGEPFQDIYLTTEPQTWATDDGQIHSSLVVTSCDADLARKAKAKDSGMTTKRRAALAVLEAAGEAGLSWSAWLAASGMSRTAFYEAVNGNAKGDKGFVSDKLVDVLANGNYRFLASSVSSVRFGFGSGELA